MIHSITEWIAVNYVELLGAILGLIYIYLSIRQKILTWPVGLLSSVFYILIFFQARLYAGMGLQVYYAAMSIYGWYYWVKGENNTTGEKLNVSYTKPFEWIMIAAAFFVVLILIVMVLKNYTDSDVPFIDAFTTTAGIIATWMMARKLIENWIIWVFTDLISVFLYIEKQLWVTALLYLVFTTMAILGFIEWRKNLKRLN
ncbi:MAG TPA: nicotinamide riboside transporter PnuC [Prolixibacteraceae bacterium]|nr:nicotinamide riboside transporter PnuC [Prolixibacteraceae bacterium]